MSFSFSLGINLQLPSLKKKHAVKLRKNKTSNALQKCIFSTVQCFKVAYTYTALNKKMAY